MLKSVIVNPPNHRPRQPHHNMHMDARLDALTRAKREGLATQSHRSRAAALRQVMRWGLSREPLGHVNRDDTQGPVQHLFFVTESALHQEVRQAAEDAGADIAPWLRHMLREITVVDFPASWRAGDAPRRGRSCGLMSRRGRRWRAYPGTSRSRALRSFDSSSSRRLQGRFRRAGRSRLTSDGDHQEGER
jgi:hypothetical protein